MTDAKSALDLWPNKTLPPLGQGTSGFLAPAQNLLAFLPIKVVPGGQISC